MLVSFFFLDVRWGEGMEWANECLAFVKPV